MRRLEVWVAAVPCGGFLRAVRPCGLRGCLLGWEWTLPSGKLSFEGPNSGQVCDTLCPDPPVWEP